MFYILWGITWLLCILDGYFISRVRISIGGKKSNLSTIDTKWHKVFEGVLLISVFLLITSNRTGVDIVNYNNWYIREQNVSGREPLYTFLRIVAHQSGMSFYVFRAILTFIVGIFPILYFRKYKIRISYILVFYMPVLLFLDSMQFRNSLALWFLIWGTDFLIKENQKWNKWFFVICVLLAAQFHTSFYAFLIFLLVSSKRRKFYAKLLFIISILILGVSLLNERTVPFINLIYSVFLSSGDDRNYSYGSGNLIFLYPMCVHFITSIVVYYFGTKFEIKEDDNNKYKIRFINFINVVNLVFFLFVPFIMMNTTFYRYIRNLFLFNIIAIEMMSSESNSKLQCIAMSFCLSIIVVLWLYFVVGVYSTTDIIIAPVLKDGIFFWIQ